MELELARIHFGHVPLKLTFNCFEFVVIRFVGEQVAVRATVRRRVIFSEPVTKKEIALCTMKYLTENKYCLQVACIVWSYN
jgi:hypothetical protein